MERFSATMDTVQKSIKPLEFFQAILNAPWWVSNMNTDTGHLFLGKLLRSYKYDEKRNAEQAQYKKKLVKTTKDESFNLDLPITKLFWTMIHDRVTPWPIKFALNDQVWLMLPELLTCL